jgi:replicative superfamily II helicase
MYKIQANPKGSRFIEVSEEHLSTIEQYQLLRNLTDSSGIIDENVLDKLKFTVRSLLESSGGNKALLDLCLDVIYNSDMKAFGLHQLVLLYIDWSDKKNESE